MPILETEIQKGSIYRTGGNEERLVLGWDKDNRVVYSSRGGNKMNAFKNCHNKVGSSSFAKKCEAKVRQVPDVQPFIVANNAQTVVVR